MTRIQAWAVSALLVWGAPAVAALSISGTVLVEPHPSTLVRGQQATVTYTLTNTGDEPLEYAGASFDYRTDGPPSSIFPFPTEATPPCSIRYLHLGGALGVPGFVVQTIDFNPVPIQPGESRQCVSDLRVSEQSAMPFVKTFRIGGRAGDQWAYATTSIAFTLGEPPLAIPALSIWGLVATALAVLLAVLYRLRVGA